MRTSSAILAALIFITVMAVPTTVKAQTCGLIPDTASEAERIILENQCKILNQIASVTFRVGTLEERVKPYHPNGPEMIRIPEENKDYIIYTPEEATTGGNPCALEGDPSTLACSNYLLRFWEDVCPDGQCNSILSPEAIGAQSDWDNHFLNPGSDKLDPSKIVKYWQANPEMMGIIGDAIIFDMNEFLNSTNPADFQ